MLCILLTRTKTPMSGYILYGGDFTRALITQMVMAEGEIDYELRKVDILKNEHRSESFLKINPAGWVPTLITPEGGVLYETPAINLFLVDRHRLEHLAPMIEDPDRGRFLSALFYISGELEPAMKRYFYPHRFVIDAREIEAMKHKALEDALERLHVIDQRLSADGPFHLGARFSLVDLMLTFWVNSLEEQQGLDAIPAVVTCATRTMDRPALQTFFAESRQWVREYKQRQLHNEDVQ